MAARLTSPRIRTALLLVLVLGVAVLHGLVITWLDAQLPAAGSLRPMPEAMFTREIAPTPPRAAAVQAAPSPPPSPQPSSRPKQPLAGKKPILSATESIANTTPLSTPTQPKDEPPPVAPPTAAASEPVTTSTVAVTTPTQSTSILGSDTTEVARWQDIWPESTRLTYKLGGYWRGDLHGSARVDWQLQGEQYQTSVVVSVLFIQPFSMSSQGRITPDGLYPQAYQETELGKRRVLGFTDDSLTLGNGARVPRTPQVQDAASQFVDLAFRMATGRATLEVGQVIRYHMVRPEGVDEWVYDVVGEDTLDTPRLGPVQAFHLKPRPLARPRGPVTMEMWYAPSLDYLPARIKIFRGTGSYVDLMIDKRLGEAEAPKAPATPPLERERP
jgi:Protein of unknown function (DUF3108)